MYLILSAIDCSLLGRAYMLMPHRAFSLGSLKNNGFIDSSSAIFNLIYHDSNYEFTQVHIVPVNRPH